METIPFSYAYAYAYVTPGLHSLCLCLCLCHRVNHRGETGSTPAYVAWLNCVNHVTSGFRYASSCFDSIFVLFAISWIMTFEKKRHERQNLSFDVRHLRFVSYDVTFDFEITSGCRPWLRNASCPIYHLYNFNMPFQKYNKPFSQSYTTHEFRFRTLLESSEAFGCTVFRFFLFNTDRGLTSSGCFRFRCGLICWFVEFLNSLRIFLSCSLGSRRDFSTCL